MTLRRWPTRFEVIARSLNGAGHLTACRFCLPQPPTATLRIRYCRQPLRQAPIWRREAIWPKLSQSAETRK